MTTIDEIPGEGQLVDNPQWVRELFGKGDIDAAYQNGLKTGERRAAEQVADLTQDNANLHAQLDQARGVADALQVELDETRRVLAAHQTALAGCRDLLRSVP